MPERYALTVMMHLLKLAVGFAPGLRGDLRDLVVGHVRQAGEHVPQIGIGVLPAAAAALDQRIDDGGALTGYPASPT